MKQNNSGFSLVETVVAIAILGMFAVSTCTSLVLGLRMNEKTEAMLNAQLAVSSAVEILMAEGIDSSQVQADGSYPSSIDNISIMTSQVGADDPFYTVVVSTNADISVTTHIRKAVAE